MLLRFIEDQESEMIEDEIPVDDTPQPNVV